MPKDSIFKNTHTKSYLPSNDFIEAWKRRLEEMGYKPLTESKTWYVKDSLNIMISDMREWGEHKVNQYVQIGYRIDAPGQMVYITDDIPLEEFEIKANEIIKQQ